MTARLRTQPQRPQPHPFLPVHRAVLQRKCACGDPPGPTGECESCRKKKLQRKLTISASNDPLEQEADRIADEVLAAPAHSAVSDSPPRIQRFAGQASGTNQTVPASVDRALASPGKPLNPPLRQDMEQRFGHDFSQVRVHSGPVAEQSARDVNAYAYTAGHNVVFGAGSFAPGTREGQRLLAHELTHVLQQSGSSAVVRRTPKNDKEIEIVDARRASPDETKTSKRKAAVSCDIACGEKVEGTLHAMPLFHHRYDKDPEKAKIVELSETALDQADGIGIALHFIKRKSKEKKGCGCTQFKFIQVVDTTHELDKAAGKMKPGTSVDINRQQFEDHKKTHPADPITPYYGDWAANRHLADQHIIPPGYKDPKRKVKADQSMFDRPALPAMYRADHADVLWTAEARLVCLRDGAEDRILGGVVYGFSMEFFPSTSYYKPISKQDTNFQKQPSRQFTDTLSKDMKDYAFEGREKPKKP